MRIDERLVKQNKKLNKKPDPDDRDEDTLMYAPRKRAKALNDDPGAFQKNTFRGINSDPNVFDQTAVFRT
ncbi:MAG: hypothetical protein IK016_03805 [Lachnospiraceae bacterium]|nr:hypothetical protein [Lachnospiraceae bacterium]